MFWSDITETDKQEALKIGKQFNSGFRKSDYVGIGKLLNNEDIFIGNGRWLNKHQFIEALEKNSNGLALSGTEASAYTFDEFLNNHINNDLIKKTYEIFDNHSVLVNLVDQDPGTSDVLLVIRKTRVSSWEIKGVIGIISKGNFSLEIDKGSFRIESIAAEGIRIPIPEVFTKPDIINNQTIFYFEGKSGRDAVFQVMSDQLKAKIYYYTYKFVEHNNQQFKMSNLVVRYIPLGILYEYEVLDPEGVTNKGITVGIQKGGKVILVQYYSFIDVYEKLKDQVNYTFFNITL
jgi:hypothetical protein